MNSLALGGSYQMSTAGQMIFDQLNQGYALSATDQENRGYILSLSVRFSLYDLLSRNNQIKIAHHQMHMSVQQKGIYEQQVREQVILLYYSLKRILTTLAIRSDARQAAEIHRQMAEKEFVEGEITVAELARVTEMEAKAIEGFEILQIEYQETQQLLENLIGQKLSTLR